MNNSYNRNNDDPVEMVLDKITDAMDSLDCDSLIDSIHKSVDVIQKEAERGYRTFQDTADYYKQVHNGRMNGADQSWFTGENSKGKTYRNDNGKPSDEELEQERRRQFEEAHRASEYSYRGQYDSNKTATHRASSGEYTRDKYTNGRNYAGTAKGSQPIDNNMRKSYKKMKPVIRQYPGDGASYLEMIAGALGTICCFGGALVRIMGAALFGMSGMGTLIFLLVAAAAFAGLLWHGISVRGRIKRLKKYDKCLRGKDYCDLEDLAKASGQPLDEVRKDMKMLLEKKCMPGVTMDKSEKCLMLTDDVRKQYEDAEYARMQRELEEAHQKAMEEAEALKKANATKEERAWMEFDEQYKEFYKDLSVIRSEMDTPVMKEHVEKIDALLKRVYDCVADHKDMIGSTGHLTSYYFPCMSKLFHTYLDLEEQPIQGDNITKTKTEIENSFDTIEKALTNMYDEMFMNISMDISSDISVLKTMMARDGWSEEQMKAAESTFADELKKAEKANRTVEQASDKNSEQSAASAAEKAFNDDLKQAAADAKQPAAGAKQAAADVNQKEASAKQAQPAEKTFADDLKEAEARAEKAAEDAMKAGGAAGGYAYASQQGAAGAYATMPEKKA